ncbi:MAG: hypothetical protein MUC94_11870, partial [bacterium]|nr:hypothetical protein [bacterium]
MQRIKTALLSFIMICCFGMHFQCSNPNPVSPQLIENRTIQHRNDINQDQVWSADSIHIISNPIAIHHAILKIEPGTIVKFERDAALSIMDSAGLLADGSAKAISFTSDIKEKGSWKYIYFSREAFHDSCRLIECNLEYGGGDSIRSGIIFCDGASPIIKSCTISKSGICGVVLFGDCSGCQFDSNLVANCDFVPIQTYPINVPLLSGNSYQDNGLNQIRIIDRLIDFDVVWKNLSLPYRVADGLEIRGGKLVLEAGVELIFEDLEGVAVQEQGILEANGTATHRVIFTGSAGETWRGIHFAETADFLSSRLVHCVVEKGGQDAEHPANIIVEGGLPEILNCIIQFSVGYGIYGLGSLTSNSFSNNIITRNTLAPISVPTNSVPAISEGDYLGNGMDVIEVRGGTAEGLITQNGYWQNLKIPYLVKNVIDINSCTITVAPGVKIEMAEHASIIVRNGGGLIANGAFAPIEIVGAQSLHGTWDSIYFSPTASAANCQLVNCYIRFGGGDANKLGMIYCDNVSPTIKNCFIEYSQTWGIYLNGNV